VQQACTEGIIAGCRVTDVKIDFYDGKMHPVDSKDIAFQIAGYFAFKEAFTAAKPLLLEPIETVEIHIPEDCMGKVMGDLSSRRGKISAWTPTARSKSSRPACRRRSFTIIPARCAR
jgi:elongation factor G